MARLFRREGDRVVARLRPYEVEILRALVRDVMVLVAEDVPENPVTARLFPDPSFDKAVADELRGLIQDDLREAKRDAARALTESLPDDGRVSLGEEEAEAWLRALNDVRLMVGTSLGITEDMYDEETDDPEVAVYQWLSFLQESLVDAVSGGLDR